MLFHFQLSSSGDCGIARYTNHSQPTDDDDDAIQLYHFSAADAAALEQTIGKFTTVSFGEIRSVVFRVRGHLFPSMFLLLVTLGNVLAIFYCTPVHDSHSGTRNVNGTKTKRRRKTNSQTK